MNEKSEKRKHERYPLSVPIKIKCRNNSETMTFESSSRDISSSGVFIKTEGLDLQCRDKVHLELTLTINKIREMFGNSGKVVLEVEGSVVRKSEDGIVIGFDKNYSIFPIKSRRRK